MHITLKNISKRYNRETIFKGVDYTFESGKSYAITGANGSGKSTLVQVIAGYLRPSSGEIKYGDSQDAEQFYKHLSIATPYLELIEEFTLDEIIDFHFGFTKARLTKEDFLKKSYLLDARNKYIKHFSSGMKQRLKLALALFSESEVIFLDEPTTNLDRKGVAWYLKETEQLINSTEKSTTLIIASNQSEEYTFCEKSLEIEDYK